MRELSGGANRPAEEPGRCCGFAAKAVGFGRLGVVQFQEKTSPRENLPLNVGPVALGSAGPIIHVAPAEQPDSAHEIAGRLFPAYTVDGGKVHLAGCTLEDRLFVRMDFGSGEQSLAIYLDAEGGEVAAERVEALGMAETTELEKPPRPFAPQLQGLVDSGVRLAQARASAGSKVELLGRTAVWCKFTEGKLRFSVEEASADLPFGGWTRTLRPPPFVCPHTGTTTFHLAATGDGRIVAADQTERCAETGRRMLREELVCCAATGRRVIPELTRTCSVSGDRVLIRAMVECRSCHQRVSPSTVHRDRCAACRTLRPVSKADSRMARLLDEHPPLDRWRNWRIAETLNNYVLTAAGWFRRLMVVVDKDSLEIKLLATGHRVLGTWNVVEPGEYELVLK